MVSSHLQCCYPKWNAKTPGIVSYDSSLGWMLWSLDSVYCLIADLLLLAQPGSCSCASSAIGLRKNLKKNDSFFILTKRIYSSTSVIRHLKLSSSTILTSLYNWSWGSDQVNLPTSLIFWLETSKLKRQGHKCIWMGNPLLVLQKSVFKKSER